MTIANRRPILVALLAVAVASIRVRDVSLRLPLPAATAGPRRSETEIAPLARFAHWGTITDAQRSFVSLVKNAAQSEAWIVGPAQTATLWTDHLIITPPLRDRDAIVLKVGDHVALGLLAVRGPQLPFSAFNVPADVFASAPQKRPTAVSVAGEPVVVVARTAERVVYAAAHVVQRAETTCGVASVLAIALDSPLAQTQVGAGVFDGNGYLRGVVVPCENRYVVIDATVVDALLKELRPHRFLSPVRAVRHGDGR